MKDTAKKLLLAPFIALVVLILMGKLDLLNSSSLFSHNQTFIFKNLYGFLAFELIILYLLATFVMYFVAPRPNVYQRILRNYVRSKTTPKNIFLGVLGGVLVTAASVAVMVFLLGQMVMLDFQNPAVLATFYPNSLLDMIVVVPLLEEFLYRGVLMNLITELVYGRKGKILAVLMSALIFGFTHPSMPEIKFITGLGFALIYILPKERNLILPVTAHMVSNFLRILTPSVAASL